MIHHNLGEDVALSIKQFAQWTLTLVLILVSKAEGIVESVPTIELPEHSYDYLPQLHVLIPHLIVAGSCAIFSLACVEGVKWGWKAGIKKIKSWRS